ncbi:MAG: hypothetical protein Tsb009_30970 [Planctomycetaceae bacterium]
MKRVLLIGQSPDGHPWSTHEYMAGMRILAQCLQPVEGLQTFIVNADNPWKEGPELLDGADVAVLFVSQGAHWLQQKPARLAAFQRLAKRGGGLVVIHWGMGCRKAKDIARFLELFGGCHGGPDRKYKIVTAKPVVVSNDHPVTANVKPTPVKEEFYYTLKFVKSKTAITPLLRVKIDGSNHTVAWAWQRPDGGRSFGFSGFHYHKNWEKEYYRRLVTQAVIWAAGKSVPKNGLPLKFSPSLLSMPRPKPNP